MPVVLQRVSSRPSADPRLHPQSGVRSPALCLPPAVWPRAPARCPRSRGACPVTSSPLSPTETPPRTWLRAAAASPAPSIPPSLSPALCPQTGRHRIPGLPGPHCVWPSPWGHVVAVAPQWTHCALTSLPEAPGPGLGWSSPSSSLRSAFPPSPLLHRLSALGESRPCQPHRLLCHCGEHQGPSAGLAWSQDMAPMAAGSRDVGSAAAP